MMTARWTLFTNHLSYVVGQGAGKLVFLTGVTDPRTSRADPNSFLSLVLRLYRRPTPVTPFITHMIPEVPKSDEVSTRGRLGRRSGASNFACVLF